MTSSQKETSRSARKFDPARTVRYHRADPRGSSIMLGFDRNSYETTNGQIQRQVANGSVDQANVVKGERSVSNRRKRGMLNSSLTFGNAKNDWKTEAKQHYNKFDLKSWGPRSLKQQDSYSWTKDDRNQLTALRDAKCLPSMVEYPQYNKLPPISNNGSSKKTNGGGYNSDAAAMTSKKNPSRQRRIIASMNDDTDY